MTNTIAPQQLVKEANAAHKLFCESWAANKQSILDLGRAIVLLEEKSLHQYIAKPGSKKGFASLEEAVLAWTNGECGSTKMYDAKRIYLLTVGENAIPADVVTQMPKRNQLQLARIPEKKRTEKLVERAVSEPILTFAETAQRVVNEDLPAEKQKEPMAYVSIKAHVRAVSHFNEVFDDIQRLPVVRDGDRTLDLETKTLEVCTSVLRVWCEDEIEKAKKKAKDAQPEIPTEAINKTIETQSAEEELMYAAPDAGEAIGRAEAEGRVVHRKPEARN